MGKNYPEIVSHLSGIMRQMHKDIPDAMRGFGALADKAKASGALDAKTKELIAVAISIALRCDGCIGFHVRGAVKAGATREEFGDMVAMAIMMGGGPSTVYGAYAFEAFNQFSE
ncbi:MAG: carboxymuconolactone decarboxylase family protein [Hyphomicrobiales bacterium]|nr:carboxymuconolactone decarboxylase family protein [Hyphomicrobiales bacterium]